MRWLLQLKWLLRRSRGERELTDELRDHLEEETESNIRSGMTPEEARFAAQKLLGSVDLYKEQCRDERSIGFIETSIRDVRYALRMLRRTPLFTVVAMLTLAIGIGANTTVFTFIENILLRSIAAHEPDRLAVVDW